MERVVFTDLIDIVVSREEKIQRYGECKNLADIMYKVFGSLDAESIFKFNDLHLHQQYSIVYFSACRIVDQYGKGVRNLDRLVGCVRRALRTGSFRDIGWCWLPDWYKEVERCSYALEDESTRHVYTLEQCEEFYKTIQDGEKLIDSCEYVYNSRARVHYYYMMHKNRSEYLITEIRKLRQK